mgnify:CR=1 FL=1
MEIEHLIFSNILDKESFLFSSTQQKIKILVEKDIFWTKKIWSRYGEFNCIDIKDIDFLKIGNTPFDFFKTYYSGDYTISLNPLVGDEIFNDLCATIQTQTRTDEIDYELSTLHSKKQKIRFLKSKIKELDVFNLKDILVEYNSISERFDLHTDTAFYTKEKSQALVGDWLTGYNDQTFYGSFYPELINFYKDYSKLCIVNYCYFKIQDEISGNDNATNHFETQNETSSNDNSINHFNIEKAKENISQNKNRFPEIFKTPFACELFFLCISKTPLTKLGQKTISAYYQTFKGKELLLAGRGSNSNFLKFICNNIKKVSKIESELERSIDNELETYTSCSLELKSSSNLI